MRELRRFLTCGVLIQGFARVHCPACGRDILVAFSCKGRGFCPSCGGRRMAETAAHLVDRVLPDVPVRQWVLTFPWRLRFLLAYDPALCRSVRRLLLRAVFRCHERRAAALGGLDARSGAVNFVQRTHRAGRASRSRDPARRLGPRRASGGGLRSLSCAREPGGAML